MRFSTILAALAPLGIAVAQTTWPVTVGGNGTLTFSPSSVNASENDIIMFTFVANNHTATQSSFADPCTPLSGGADSNFQPVNTTVTSSTFNYTVANASAPLWFFCKQTTPKNHCQNGMVFAINPPATGNHTFGAFQQAAMSLANATSNTTSTSSGSSTASGSSTSASGTAPPASSSSSPAGALRVGATGALLGGVGLLALAF